MEENRSLKPLAPVVIGLFMILLAGSIFFFKERMLFLDAPHILFRIINKGTLVIEMFRYGLFITQLFPWVAVRLHLPISAVILLYFVFLVRLAYIGKATPPFIHREALLERINLANEQ